MLNISFCYSSNVSLCLVLEVRNIIYYEVKANMCDPEGKEIFPKIGNGEGIAGSFRDLNTRIFIQQKINKCVHIFCHVAITLKRSVLS